MKLYEKYLTEAIDSKSKRKFLSIIDNFPKGKSKMEVLGDTVEIKGENNSVTFTYPEKNIEITTTLVDIVDSIPARSFDYNDKGGKITFIVKGE